MWTYVRLTLESFASSEQNCAATIESQFLRGRGTRRTAHSTPVSTAITSEAPGKWSTSSGANFLILENWEGLLVRTIWTSFGRMKCSNWTMKHIQIDSFSYLDVDISLSNQTKANFHSFHSGLLWISSYSEFVSKIYVNVFLCNFHNICALSELRE